MPDERWYVAEAPLRVDAAGGATDAPPFVLEHAGCVVNFAISRRVRVELAVHPDRPDVRIRSRDFGAEVHFESAERMRLDGVLDLPKAVVQRLRPPFGFDLRIASEAPPGSGIGSSGALGVALVGAFSAAMGRSITPREAADLGNSIERDDLAMRGGNQDSLGSALGGINRIDYEPGGAYRVERIPVAPEVVAEMEERCVLVYTGASHVSGSIHADIHASYADPEGQTQAVLHGMRRVACESAEALAAGDLDAWGRLLSENWAHHQRLHASCGSERLDRFYEAARPHVTGGKTCGAGGGGCILFLARPGSRSALERALERLGGELLPFCIDFDGLRVCSDD